MATIKITSQSEWDALQDQFEEWTEIQIVATAQIIIGRRLGNSSVVAWGNSSVVARDNSSVVAWGNSSVVARDNSSVEARDNSSVEAWGNSSVEAWDQCVTRYFSSSVSLSSHGQAVIFQYVAPDKAGMLAGKTVIRIKTPGSTEAWLSTHGLVAQRGAVILFKRVSAEFKTQENTANETVWTIGSTLNHSNWNPTEEECGVGKFHACPKTYFCDEFRQSKGDKYIAIKIAVKDLHVWSKNPSYPHKIAFRAGTVLYECDKKGNQIG